jgi:hypothetical protein
LLCVFFIYPTQHHAHPAYRTYGGPHKEEMRVQSITHSTGCSKGRILENALTNVVPQGTRVGPDDLEEEILRQLVYTGMQAG